jgi:hypothetical protein
MRNKLLEKLQETQLAIMNPDKILNIKNFNNIDNIKKENDKSYEILYEAYKKLAKKFYHIDIKYKKLIKFLKKIKEKDLTYIHNLENSYREMEEDFKKVKYLYYNHAHISNSEIDNIFSLRKFNE